MGARQVYQTAFKAAVLALAAATVPVIAGGLIVSVIVLGVPE